MSEFVRRLACRFPLIQAPMAGVQDQALALAVSRAGGLGNLPGAMLSVEALRSALRALQDSGLPYGVNFFAHAQTVPSPALMRAWTDRLAPFFERWNLDTAHVPGEASRQPFGAAQVLAAWAAR